MDFFKDLIPPITLLFTIATFFYGLKIWKDQLRYKEKREVASELISTLYELKDVFSHLRSPWGYEVPVSEDEKKKYEDENHIKAYSEVRLFIDRYNKVSEKFTKFQSVKYKYMTLIDKSDEKFFNEIMMLLNKISNAAHYISEYKHANYKYKVGDEKETESVYFENMDILYEGFKENKTSIRLNEIINHFESKCFKLTK